LAKPQQTYNAKHILSLAFAAHRIKGGYSNSVVYPYDDKRYYDRFTNKNLILFVINPACRADNYTGEVEITDEDIANVEAMYTFFRRLSFEVLGNDLSDFERSMAEVILADTITESQIGIAACVPKVYLDRLHKRDLHSLMKDTNQEHLGIVGTKYEIDITIIDSKLIERLGCYEHIAITSSNHLVGFLNNNQIGKAPDQLTISAKVKAHGISYGTSFPRTDLNYVKIVKKI
jgi:hypothetical protein